MAIKTTVHIAKFFVLFIIGVSTASVNYSFAQKNDSIAVPQKGFKSLFVNNNYDASKTYTAQLNPRAIAFVQDYVRKQGKELERMKQWGKSYFNLYDNILAQYNIPPQMKYLSVIESHLQSNLVSWAGAVGPWQIMDYEAKRFGLRMGPSIDERMDYVKSTHVACKLMKELYNEFGDWLLVVAAYNGGAGRVRGAIRKSGSRDFWDLQYFVLEETRNHVKKFIATHYVFEGSGGLTTMTAAETKQHLQQVTAKQQQMTTQNALQDSSLVGIPISGRYNSVILCNALGISIADFNKHNFNFDQLLAEGNNFTLYIPKEKQSIFTTKKQDILMQSLRLLLN